MVTRKSVAANIRHPVVTPPLPAARLASSVANFGVSPSLAGVAALARARAPCVRPLSCEGIDGKAEIYRDEFVNILSSGNKCDYTAGVEV